MVLFKQNKKWKAIHISLDLKKLDEIDAEIEKVVRAKLDETHLNRQWKAIDIVDVQFVASAYQPPKNTTFIELLVFVVDITGEQLDKS